MRYFEFNKTDYYALVAVATEEDAITDAMETYVKYVAYDSVDELISDALYPDELTKDQALLKFLTAKGNEDYTVGQLVKEFEACDEDCVLLIDYSLI
mgnify:FL=1